MIDPNRLCPNCMGEKPQKEGNCPFCGYGAVKPEQSPRCMPPYTILAGRYLVGTVLGEGGFGITYRGFDLNQNRKIAIKEYFPAGLVTRDTSRGGDNTVQSISGQMRVHYKAGLEKYENEAKCLMSLKGTKGIVDILDFFHENGTAYIVMEFIEGKTLRKHLEDNRGCIPEQQMLLLFQPLLQSLRAVHQAGIVHRDISPDNILLQPDGTLKLIDFGAARQSTGEATQSLTVILKHGYAPEEQYRSRARQGPFTDVYAISATMYKALTGVTPVDAMSRMLEDELVPLREYPNRISEKTCRAIEHGMAVRAENRFQTIGALAAALYDKEVTVEPTMAMPVSKRKHTKKMLALIAAGVAACALLIAGVSALVRPNAAQELPQLPEQPPVTETEPEPVEAPDVTGLSETEARAQLEALDFLVTVVQSPADGAHAGKVLAWEQTSEHSVTLTVGQLTKFLFEENEDGVTITGVETRSQLLELPERINNIPVTAVGAYAFAEDGTEEQCLHQLILPEGLRRIEEGAFSGCMYLTQLELPDTVTQIGDGAFWSCSAISQLKLPAKLEEIGQLAFQYCYGLPEIVLPEGCQSVGDQAFEGCMRTARIVVPASVQTLGAGAFTGCENAVLEVAAGSPGEAYAEASDLPYVTE